MSEVGYSGKPLREKLVLKERHRTRFENVPGYLLGRLEPLPEANDPPFEFVMWFPASVDELQARFAECEGLLAGVGMFWVAWPKKSSPLRNTLDFAAVQCAGLNAGLVDTKICSVTRISPD